MKHGRLAGAFLLAIILAFSTTLVAQQLSKGSIGGTVLDSTGAVVVGAKVTASSDYGTKEATSGPDGTFVILNMEPGTWSIKVEFTGFKTAEVKNVPVRLNERTGVRVTLEPGVVTQVVEVTGVAIGIDTSTTSSGGTVMSSLYQNAPVGRNISEIPYLVAGVGDSLGVGRANPSISGATGLENQYVVNGVNITNAGFGGIGTYAVRFGSLGSGVQFDFVKEVQVKTSGFEAQYGQALGGVVNLITKSGGNSYHGGAYFYANPSVFEAGIKQPNQVNFFQGTETTGFTGYDVGGELGGYLKKDRFFWYAGFDAVWNREDKIAPANFLARALGEVTAKTRILNYSSKFNWNITANQNHQLEVSLFGDPAEQPVGPNAPTGTQSGGPLSTDYPGRAFDSLSYGSRNFSVRYNANLRPTWLMNASFAWAHNEFTDNPAQNIWDIDVRTEGTVGGINPVGNGLPTPTTSRGLWRAGGIGFFENNNGNNKQYAVNGSNMFHKFGGHQVDYGFTFEDVEYDWFHRRSGPDWTQPCFTYTGTPVNFVDARGSASADCGRTVFGALLRLRTGGPSGYRFQQIRGAFTGQQGATHTKYGAIYLQDAWQLNKYITLKLGLRWEQQNIRGVDTHYDFTGNWSPRAGIIVDPWGNRRTKIFFNFGRFVEKMPNDLAVRSLSEERSYISQLFAITNPGSANPLFNSRVNPTPGCSATDTLINCLFNPANWILTQGHLTNSSPVFSGGITAFNAGTKMQYQDEYVFGVEHEFRGGVIISARYLDRRLRRIVEDIAGLTVGGSNIGIDVNGDPISQTFILANPSANIDVFHNTLCTNGLDPFNENIDPNAGAVFGCGSFEDPDGTDHSFYAPGSGNPGSDGLPDGFPNPIRKYQAFEFSVEKRFSKNWQMFGNWRISKLFGNYEGLYRNDNGQDDPNITSLFDFPRSSSLGDQFNPAVLPTDRRDVVNFYANYLFNMGLNLGVGWRFQTGYPLSKLGAHPAYLNQGEVPIGGRGAQGRSPATATIDFHADYTWKVTEKYRVKFVADLFNIVDSLRVTRVDQWFDTGFLTGVNPPIQQNPDFLHPYANVNAYQRPFYARFAVRFEF